MRGLGLDRTHKKGVVLRFSNLLRISNSLSVPKERNERNKGNISHHKPTSVSVVSVVSPLRSVEESLPEYLLNTSSNSTL
jgi:hypothetical protein